jgi:hypothetical protein
MVTDGVEIMIGVSDDPVFGPLVAFGLGGIHVEVLHDVQFRIAPLTDRDADELIHSIRGFVCCGAIAATAPPTSTPCANCCCESRGWLGLFPTSRSSISIR